MDDLLRDPIWQFISAVLGLISIIVVVIIHIRNAKRKKLSYELLYKFPIFEPKGYLPEDLKIHYRGKKVTNLYAQLLKIWNSGTQTIQATDFQQPLSIEVGHNTEILAADVIRSSPSKISATTKIDKGLLYLEPLLLNSGDSIIVRIITNKAVSDVRINTRITGVKKIAHSHRASFLRFLQRIVCIFLFADLAIIALYFARAGGLRVIHIELPHIINIMPFLISMWVLIPIILFLLFIED